MSFVPVDTSRNKNRGALSFGPAYCLSSSEVAVMIKEVCEEIWHRPLADSQGVHTVA